VTGPTYTMCPMKLRLAVLAAALLLPLTACDDEAPRSPQTSIGDQVEGRTGDLEAGERTAVVTPAGRLTVSFGDPVRELDKEQTTDLVARTAPEGASFVPLVWSFQEDVFGKVALLFGDRKPLEVALVSDGERYPLTPPEDATGQSTEYVVVDGAAKHLQLEVTYNKVTQTLDARTGRLDKGVAAGLYALPRTKIRIKDCPIKQWFTEPAVFPQYTCQYTTAIPSPYVAETWAKPGHTWLSVTVATNLALYATGELGGAIASYRVVDSKELSTIGGRKSLGTLREKVDGGLASGTIVFEVKGRLPRTMRLMREYELSLNGAAGKVDAPQHRTVRIGGDVPLLY
jgi:hypothetical protein